MKLLLFHAWDFWVNSYPESGNYEKNFKDAIVIFTQCEKEDEERRSSVVRKAVKYINWYQGKLSKEAGRENVTNIVFHTFAHLSASKAKPEFAEEVLEEIKDRLSGRFTVHVIPLGLYEFKIFVDGNHWGKVLGELSSKDGVQDKSL